MIILSSMVSQEIMNHSKILMLHITNYNKIELNKRMATPCNNLKIELMIQKEIWIFLIIWKKLDLTIKEDQDIRLMISWLIFIKRYKTIRNLMLRPKQTFKRCLNKRKLLF